MAEKFNQEGSENISFIRKKKELEKLEKLKADLEKKLQEELQAEIRASYLDTIDQIEDAAKSINEHNQESWKKVTENIRNNLDDALLSSGFKALNNLKTQLDTIMDEFVSTQEAMAYNLNGTGSTLTEVTDGLTNALAGSGIVKQQAVYQNLTELVKSGIVFNAEQRAYLATIAEDLGMTFDVSNNQLTRLINIFRDDLSDERVAIEYSLKEFLNQNYMTSQYIKDGFESVSNSLLEAQSLMGSTQAMEFEAVVQKWLGSFSSVGMSTSSVSSIAEAIGQLGSGNVSSLSNSSMLNLMALGASKANLSFSELMTGGLNSNNTNQLLQGIYTVIKDIYDTGKDNNVVLSEYAKVFGLTVSDVQALNNLTNVEGLYDSGISTNVNNLLGDMGDYVYTTTKISNLLANVLYEWGTGVASSDTRYLGYKTLDMLTSIASDLSEGTTITAGVFGNGVELNLSEIITATSLIGTIGSLGRTIGSIMTNIGSTDAESIYAALGQGSGLSTIGGQQYINAVGLDNNTESGKSQSIVIFNEKTSDYARQAKVSATEALENTVYEQEETTHDLNDVYTLLNDSLVPAINNLKNATYASISRIDPDYNVVRVGNDLTTIQDSVAITAMNTQNIYALLLAYMTNSESVNIVDTSSYEWSNNEALSWIQSPSKLVNSESIT